MLRVKFSPIAQEDLSHISEFGIQRFGAPQAEAYTDELIDRAYCLAENRSLWKRRDDIEQGLCSYFQGSHQLFFELREETLRVHRILHQSMDPARHLTNEQGPPL